jgi:hypothetical protein
MMTTYEMVAKNAAGRNTDLSNALVLQKDALVRQIIEAEDAEALMDCVKMLKVLALVWNVSDYGYKTGDMKSRIRGAAHYQSRTAYEKRIDSPRRGSRQWARWNDEITKLEEVVNAVDAIATK